MIRALFLSFLYLFLVIPTTFSQDAYQLKIDQAKESENDLALWQAYMSAAWHKKSLAEYQDALSLSNKALALGKKLKDDYRQGRSLIWVGLSYASMGYYELALEFYEKAVEIGAPDGTIKIVAVWGFALQEMGSVYLRLGDLETAKKTVERTTDFARENNIPVGIAEGGVYLAQIALEQGEYEKARSLATETLLAAKDCKCGTFNIARAYVSYAKVLLETRKSLSDDISVISQAIDDALNYSNKHTVKRYIAEAKILKSKFSNYEDEKYQLAMEAFEILTTTEDEKRGSAEAYFGKVLLGMDHKEMARRYLENGIKVNEELFRKLDVAYIAGDLAELEEISGRTDIEVGSLIDAAEKAFALKVYPLALKNQLKVMNRLHEIGFLSASSQWGYAALASIEMLLKAELSEQEKAGYKQQKREIVLGLAQVELALDQSRDNSK